LTAAIFFLSASLSWAGEYDLEIPEAKKNPWELGGKLEFGYIFHQLDQESAAYRLKTFNEDERDQLSEWRTLLEWQGGYRRESFRFFLSAHHEYDQTDWGEEWTHRVYQGYFSITPSPRLTVDIGKKTFLWGKGYAWNPAGFINRPKDPDDPELSLEGFTAFSFDYIKSYAGGGLTTVAVTPVILPVFNWENTSLGESGEVNYAVKLYFLIYDTDIDLIYYGGPSQPDSYGVDFSTNLKENLEFHGELAWQKGVRRVVLDSSGRMSVSEEDQTGFLLGVRYLTASETTFIIEYYRNGAGYDRGEIEDFFAYQEAVYSRFLAGRDPSVMTNLVNRTRAYYAQKNFGRDYFYFKLSQKEPGGILYFTPWAAVIMNLQDFSFSLSPGLTYLPSANVEFAFKIIAPIGPPGTEFAEKQDDLRSEFLIRYYF